MVRSIYHFFKHWNILHLSHNSMFANTWNTLENKKNQSKIHVFYGKFNRGDKWLWSYHGLTLYLCRVLPHLLFLGRFQWQDYPRSVALLLNTAWKWRCFPKEINVHLFTTSTHWFFRHIDSLAWKLMSIFFSTPTHWL